MVCVLSLLCDIIDPLLVLLVVAAAAVNINVLVTSSRAHLTIFCLFIFPRL